MDKVRSIFSAAGEDMQEYYRKLSRHRLKVIVRGVAAALLIVLLIAGIGYYQKNRSYTRAVTLSSVERQDTVTTKYARFGGKILKYGRDGISYTDEKNRQVFSAAYTMQEPQLALSEKSGAVADIGGNQIYIFDQSQLLGQIATKLPIKKAAVSNQGVVAVLLEDTKAIQFQLYTKDGTQISDGSFSLKDTGYPMNLSISSDGTKVAITFAQVDAAKIKSCIAIYNFDAVGENHTDNLVATKEYEDSVIPEVHYFDDRKLVAIGDGMMVFFEGKQIPELEKEVVIESEIQSVFYGEDRIGLVFEGDEQKYVLKVYNVSGNMISEIPFDMSYSNIYLTDDGAVICNEAEFGLYSSSGKECYRGTMDAAVLHVFPTSSRDKFILIYDSETQLIQLQ